MRHHSVYQREVNSDQYLTEMVRRTNATGRMIYGDGEPVPEWDAASILKVIAAALIVAILLIGATWIHLNLGSLWR